jgi:hypothetical protein
MTGFGGYDTDSKEGIGSGKCQHPLLQIPELAIQAALSFQVWSATFADMHTDCYTQSHCGIVGYVFTEMLSRRIAYESFVWCE